LSIISNGVKYDADVNTIAERFGKTPGYIRDMARDKKIPAIKNGGQWRFSIAAVEKALLKRNDEPVFDDDIAAL
jgi:excisionase family DNA binding protein